MDEPYRHCLPASALTSSASSTRAWLQTGPVATSAMTEIGKRAQTSHQSELLKILLPILGVLVLIIFLVWFFRRLHYQRKKEEYNIRLAHEAHDRAVRAQRAVRQPEQRGNIPGMDRRAHGPLEPSQTAPAIQRRPSDRPGFHRPTEPPGTVNNLQRRPSYRPDPHLPSRISDVPPVIPSPPRAASFGHTDYNSWRSGNEWASRQPTHGPRESDDTPVPRQSSPNLREPGGHRPDRLSTLGLSGRHGDRDSYVSADYTDASVFLNFDSDDADHAREPLPDPLVVFRENQPAIGNTSPILDPAEAREAAYRNLDPGGTSDQRGHNIGRPEFDSTGAVRERLGIWSDGRDNGAGATEGLNICRQGSSSRRRERWEDIPLLEYPRHTSRPGGVPSSYTSPDVQAQARGAGNIPRSSTNLALINQDYICEILAYGDNTDNNPRRPPYPGSSEITSRPGPSTTSHPPLRQPPPDTPNISQDGFPTSPTEESLRRLMEATDRLVEGYTDHHHVAQWRDDVQATLENNNARQDQERFRREESTRRGGGGPLRHGSRREREKEI